MRAKGEEAHIGVICIGNDISLVNSTSSIKPDFFNTFALNNSSTFIKKAKNNTKKKIDLSKLLLGTFCLVSKQTKIQTNLYEMQNK